MVRNLIKRYTIEDLKINTNEFNRIQAILNGYNIKFNVLFLDDHISIVALKIKSGTVKNAILMEKGFRVM